MAWTDTTKTWEYHRPIHRINSPCYDEEREPVSGKGYGRGCHAPSDGPTDTELGDRTKAVARGIPGWVTVLNEDEQELEGMLDRSFQTYHDIPLYQWHRYYDWNFHVAPIKGYQYVRGLGNESTADKIETMECEWDCGSFGLGRDPMFNYTDWRWPMTGHYCWFAGRWIYDCGHASTYDKSGDNEGLMRTELHPCKAVAWAQWEAVSFPENGGLYVPGIRFHFFASRLGGYKDFAAINARDYEFIVDLPRLQGSGVQQMSLERTPDFPMSTTVLRTVRLLHKTTFVAGALGKSHETKPIITEMPPASPGELAEQVKVTIPLSGQPADDDYYHVIIDFGWLDPDRSQARRVKHCRVEFVDILKGSINHDTFDEEWKIKFGVNGRWYSRKFKGVENGKKLPLNQPVDFYLSEDDAISVTAHGHEIDYLDDAFQLKKEDRLLTLDGQVMDWDKDIVPASGQRLKKMCYAFVDIVKWRTKDYNEELQKVDPEKGAPNNPYHVRNMDGINNMPLSQTALTTKTVTIYEEEKEITIVDYYLNYRLSINSQKVPEP
jgi:hypothetical protein